MLSVHILHLMQILVSINNKNRSRQIILATEKPVFMMLMQLNQIFQRNLVLFTPSSLVDPLQSFLRSGLEVYDEVNIQVEVTSRIGQELEPLIQNLVLAAQDLAGGEHVLNKAVSSTEDASLHQLDRLVRLVNMIVQHRQLNIRLEWHRPSLRVFIHELEQIVTIDISPLIHWFCHHLHCLLELLEVLQEGCLATANVTLNTHSELFPLLLILHLCLENI